MNASFINESKAAVPGNLQIFKADSWESTRIIMFYIEHN